VPRVWSLAGIAFVIAAGLGAERTGGRTAPSAVPGVPAGPAVLEGGEIQHETAVHSALG
jgi:hypothetical protein